MNFNNKVILITGASGNIGKGLINYLLEFDCKIIALDQVKLKINHKKISFFQSDFEDIQNLKKTIFKVKKKFKKIDILINNAGLTKFNIKNKKELNNFSEKKWNSFFKVNLIAADLIIREIQSSMKKKNTSCILNVASIYGCIKPDFSIYKNTKIINNIEYSVSKASLIQLTKWYASKLAPIRVNAISPGGIFKNHSKKFLDQYSSKTLLKRMAKKEEIVNAILFLSSDKASYITGENIIVDGGFFSR